jgi:hypothetical protein
MPEQTKKTTTKRDLTNPLGVSMFDGEGKQKRKASADYREKERAKDSVATRNKLTDEYWNQPSVRMSLLKNRNGWFGEGNTTDPDMKQYVGRGMQKAGFDKPSKSASKGYYGEAMKKLSKKK